MWKFHLLVLISVTIGITQANTDCTSTEKGDCCVFPFKYKGATYDSCSFLDSSKPWCSLTSNFDTDKKFGYCAFKTCEIKTTDGDCCVFPFTYSGVTYNACTKTSDSKAWCGTKSKVEFWTRKPRGDCEHYADPCFYSPCKNGGICQSNKNQFTCQCPTGWQGETCTEKANPCENSPCENGGKCFSDVDNIHFHCNCSRGYEGKTCENEVGPCDSSPCKNGGTCTDNKNSHTHTCTCTEQYEGDTCETRVDPCKNNPCLNGGKCLSDLSEFTTSCKCPNGYEGDVCQNRVYPCDSSPCENGGSCVNTENSFKCNCTNQYEGNTCERRVDPCEVNPCLNGGECLSDLSEFTTSCTCSDGYEGDICQNRVFPCDSSPCENNGTCVNTENTFMCTCTEKYEGVTCGNKVDPCEINPCLNGGECMSDLSEFTTSCTCPDGYEGDTCQNRVYPCDSSPCENNGTCENVEDNFKCTCTEHYEGDTCESRADPCAVNPCLNGGKCLSDLSEFTTSCSCPDGYDGEICQSRVYPCDSSPCENGGICANTENSFKCTCTEKFDGVSCETRVDPCKNSSCLNGGKCLSDLSEFTTSCSCPDGYEGDICENRVDPCDSSPCENNGTCLNTENTFKCTCTEKYEGATCGNKADPCEVNPCLNGGECLSDVSEFTTSCSCPDGYEGDTCQNRVYPCDSSPCENNGTCENVEDNFKCTCTEHYEGDTCESRVDPCTINPCLNGGKCLSDLSNFATSCSCPDGYEGRICQNKVNPCGVSPCENNGTCESTEDSFKCICPEQYEGETCESKVDVCKSEPCENEGVCFSDLSRDQFLCSCKEGFEGETCSEKVDPCKNSPCKNGGSCQSKDDEFSCECEKGFSGKTCELGCTSTEKGDCCVFPFKYKGKTYDSCTLVESSKPWCSLTSDYDADKKYGYCEPQSCKTTETKKGDCCVFPFKYKGKTYDSCTLVDSSKPWCSLTSDYDSDKKYGYCVPEITVNPCENSPCKNGGSCQSTDGEFSCECENGFTGKTCELKGNPCDSSPCAHSGVCKPSGDDYICDCSKTGFEGPNCANKGIWMAVTKLTPPYHIGSDGLGHLGDLGGRFVDLNGDGRLDFVYNRWLKDGKNEKGAYLNVPGEGFRSAPQFTPPHDIAADGYADLGTRFVDLNGDGKIDMAYHRWISHTTTLKGAYLNTGNGWVSAPQYTPPQRITAGSGKEDLGTRFVELNGDGKIDFVYHRWLSNSRQEKGAFINTGNGWESAPDLIPPFHIAAPGLDDLGARFADLNGDGKVDLLYHRWINFFSKQKGAYLNNGKKWTWAPQFTPPYTTSDDGIRDTGLRLIDFNGDGKIDIVYHRWLNGFLQHKGAFVNNGNGWSKTDPYIPPFHIAADNHGDLGARFADVNGDGLVDFVYYRWLNSNSQQKGAYINSGCGWRSESQYTPPYHIAADGYGDRGARLVELNGDGAIDFAYNLELNSKQATKAAYLACGDTSPAFCLIYSKYCSMWKVAYNMCRQTCNTCQF